MSLVASTVLTDIPLIIKSMIDTHKMLHKHLNVVILDSVGLYNIFLKICFLKFLFPVFLVFVVS